MKVVVTIRLYGYMDTNTINKGKRDVLIRKQKVKNRDISVQRALVISTSRCSNFIDKKHSSIIMLVFNTIRFKTDLCDYAIKFATCGRPVVFSGYSCFLHQ
jgi:hypothetical protein